MWSRISALLFRATRVKPSMLFLAGFFFLLVSIFVFFPYVPLRVSGPPLLSDRVSAVFAWVSDILLHWDCGRAGVAWLELVVGQIRRLQAELGPE